MHFVLNIAVCFSVCFVISESVRKNIFSVKSGKTINVSHTLTKRVLTDSLIECACVCNAESNCSVGVLKSNGGECSLYSANGVLSLDESTTDTVIVKKGGKDADECISKPCENGGTCQDGVNEYSCTCRSGFSGDNCQTDIDECGSNPCQNGGTCQDGVNEYSCTCRSGFSGDNCQTDIDECGSNPCQNGGTCQDGVNEYSCTCRSGFSGDNCQTDIDGCASNPCQNGGTCYDGVNEFSCTCRPGFDGDNCQTVVSVSKHRTTGQSSTPTSLYHFYGVDGDINTFFRTANEINPKWWVVLDEAYTVDLIVLRNRADCCGERLANVTVYVGSDTNTDQMKKCAYFAGPGANAQVINLHCENKPTGFVVLVSMVNNQQPLHLAEVEVYPLTM